MQGTEPTTREQRLAWTPDEAIQRLQRPGPDETSTVALAMAEQLEAAHVPIDALDACLVIWSRALGDRSPQRASRIALEQLRQDLQLQTSAAPVLRAWLAALSRPITTVQDLDYVFRFLTKVRELQALTSRSPGFLGKRPLARSEIRFRVVDPERSFPRVYEAINWVIRGLTELWEAGKALDKRDCDLDAVLRHLRAGCSATVGGLTMLREHAAGTADALIGYVELQLDIAAKLEQRVLAAQVAEARGHW